jgi:hypothetical protein
MSTDSSSTLRRERALKAARRRLRLLEIETHRIKAELARLEAEFEDDVADRLSRKRRISRGDGPHESSRFAPLRLDAPHDRSRRGDIADLRELFEPLGESAPDRPRPIERNESLAPTIAVQLDERQSAARLDEAPRGWSADYRRARPFMLSLGFHIMALFALLPMTIASLVQQQVPLVASPSFRADEAPAELDDLEFTPAALDNSQPERVAFDESKTNFAAQMLGGLLPVEPAIGSGPVAIADSLASNLSDPGAMELGPAGAGGQGTGDASGSLTFFGTKSSGNRFVFVVDNSSSMKDGRLEAAIAELSRSVDAMGRRQAFYVIFVSDQPYPLFYPQPAPNLILATPENKQLLGEWLGKVRLASGKNRELIKAVDMAAALRPDSVFLLWDADLKYSEAVRRDVLNHLTSPQPWNFTIHTLGMGALSPESEQNLADIAQAHGGTYRRIDVKPPGAR